MRSAKISLQPLWGLLVLFSLVVLLGCTTAAPPTSAPAPAVTSPAAAESTSPGAAEQPAADASATQPAEEPTVALPVLSQVTLAPEILTVRAGSEHQFSVSARDASGAALADIDSTFSAKADAGSIDSSGSFVAGTKAGNYDGAVTVEVSYGSKTLTATTDVTITPGPLDQVIVTPDTVSLELEATQQFSVELLDAFGNPITEAEVVWQVAAGLGEISEDGLLSTGTRAGAFEQGVQVVAKGQEVPVEAVVPVTVNPGPPVELTMEPVTIPAGDTLQLEALVADQHGNPIKDAPVSWELVNQHAGMVTAAGTLTAGEVAGSFDAAVQVRSAEGDLSARGNITIVPGPLDRVVVAPDPAEIGMEMTQQFVAVGADRFGNRIAGIDFAWRVAQGGGNITAEGLFTAGRRSGTFAQTVVATATQGTVERTGSADLTVEADRIAFMSFGEEEQLSVDSTGSMFFMNSDGTDIAAFTHLRSGNFLMPSWSPDGRRFAYGIDGDINIISRDGVWNFPVLSESFGVGEPAWSPDGTKIAFQSWQHDTDSNNNPEIYVMDVDGGNLVRLTNNDHYDDYPSWSPDGKRIAYISDPDGDGDAAIYVMNADGSGQRLLVGTGDNEFPRWSPDGQQIAFDSLIHDRWAIKTVNASGGNIRTRTSTEYISAFPSWTPDGRILFASNRDSEFRDSTDVFEILKGFDVYIMDADGSNVKRLTENEAFDVLPNWVPRKRGVVISEESVVIPNASSLQPMSAQEVFENARGAIVRIETDLGNGSGFIFDPAGLILTNNHVVSGAADLRIFLDDGAEYPGVVVGRDLTRDLAVVKIEAEDLPVLNLGDISRVSTASTVVVLGYPLGHRELSITSGLVSSIRVDTSRNTVWIQTDSAVNPGNSGGPLLNLQGEVIGVVSIKSVGLTIEGVGYAISTNSISQSLERIIAGETVSN